MGADEDEGKGGAGGDAGAVGGATCVSSFAAFADPIHRPEANALAMPPTLPAALLVEVAADCIAGAAILLAAAVADAVALAAAAAAAVAFSHICALLVEVLAALQSLFGASLSDALALAGSAAG